MKNDAIKHIEEKYMKKETPKMAVGDTVLVYVKIKEEGKTRTQIFEGVVMRKKGTGIRSTFTVRRISYGEGVERIFPLHSPSIEKVEVKRKGSARRAKLYYLRQRKGKKSKVEEKIEREAPPSGGNALPRAKGA